MPPSIKAQRRRLPGSGKNKSACVYILASGRRGTLYTGITSDLGQRMQQHKQHLVEGFSRRHGVTRLVWFLHGDSIEGAIQLEKKIKNRGRQWKIDLIEETNPNWKDLSVDLFKNSYCE